MSDVELPKGNFAIRPPHDCDSNIIHWGAATGNYANEVAMAVTRYGSLPLRRRDDGSNDVDSTVSSLSSDGDSRIDKSSNSIPPPKHQQLLLVAMIALPLFMAMVLLHDFIQQQTVAATHKSPSSSSSLTHSVISMYGRVKADNLSDEQDWKGDGSLKRNKHNDSDWKNKAFCNANQFQCTACNGKWCATDAPPSFITAVPTTTTAEIGSASAGYCTWGNDGTGTSFFCAAGGREAEAPISLPSDITFGDLAAFMLPTYFQGCIDLCTSTIIPSVIDETTTSTSVMPGEVALLRKTILKTRDLFDVFSPVYAENTLTWKMWSSSSFRSHFDRGYYIRMGSTLHDKGINLDKEVRLSEEFAEEDLWRTLRKLLADGYRLIGEFQDLDHAHIAYTPSQLTEYQQEVWAWRVGFTTFVETSRRHVFSYLSLPCEKQGRKSRHSHCQHAHNHVSHLFWGTTSVHDLPNGNRDKAKHALARLGNAQLKRAESYLRDALSYEYVLNSTQAEISTSSPNHHRNDDAEKGESEEESGGIINVQEKYHNARKELRSYLDELVLFGDLLLPGSSAIPEILKDGTTATTAAAARDPAPKILIDQAVNALETTRKMLGDLNDDFSAHEWYKQWNVYPEEQSILQTSIEARWKRFREWQEEVDLLSKLEFLRGVMMHPDLTWTLNPSASRSPGDAPSPSSSQQTTPPSSYPYVALLAIVVVVSYLGLAVAAYSLLPEGFADNLVGRLTANRRSTS